MVEQNLENCVVLPGIMWLFVKTMLTHASVIYTVFFKGNIGYASRRKGCNILPETLWSSVGRIEKETTRIQCHCNHWFTRVPITSPSGPFFNFFVSSYCSFRFNYILQTGQTVYTVLGDFEKHLFNIIEDVLGMNAWPRVRESSKHVWVHRVRLKVLDLPTSD